MEEVEKDNVNDCKRSKVNANKIIVFIIGLTVLLWLEISKKETYYLLNTNSSHVRCYYCWTNQNIYSDYHMVAFAPSS